METEGTFLPLKKETDLIIGACIEVHKQLGTGFLEIVYKDALEYEFKERRIFYEREKEFDVKYKGNVLKHKFYADMVVFDSIVLEIKAKEGIALEDMAQTINYLRCSSCKVGLIVNFGTPRVGIKRVVL